MPVSKTGCIWLTRALRATCAIRRAIARRELRPMPVRNSLDPGDGDPVMLIPALASKLLSNNVLGVLAPRSKRLQRLPIRDRDSGPVAGPHRVHAEMAWHPLGERRHPRSGVGVAIIHGGSLRRDDNDVVPRSALHREIIARSARRVSRYASSSSAAST